MADEGLKGTTKRLFFYKRQKRHGHPLPETSRRLKEDKCKKNDNPEENMKPVTGDQEIRIYSNKHVVS